MARLERERPDLLARWQRANALVARQYQQGYEAVLSGVTQRNDVFLDVLAYLFGLTGQVEPQGGADGEIRIRASALLALYMKPSLWVRRRTDRFEALDDVARRWTRTLEIRLPPLSALLPIGIAEHVEADWLVPIPIALHKKAVLNDFRMHDGQGKRLSMLPTSEDQPLIQTMLTMGIESVSGTSVTPLVHADIGQLVGADIEAAKAAARRLAPVVGTRPRSETARIVQQILITLIGDLQTNFILMAELPRSLRDRPTLVEYSFIDERVDTGTPTLAGEVPPFAIETRELYPSSSSSTASSVPRAQVTSMRLDVGAAPSFHLEFVAAEELDVQCLSVCARHEGEATWRVVPGVQHADVGRFSSIHLAGHPRGEELRVEFRERLHRPGLRALAVGVSLSVSIGMAVSAFARVRFDVHPATSVAAPVLVALPGALALFLAREIRHRRARRLSFEARASIALSAVTLGMAAASLTLSVGQAPPLIGGGADPLGYRAVGWFVAATLSCLVTITTIIRSRRW